MWDEIIFNSFASVNVSCTCSLYNVARVNIPRRIMNRIRKQRIKMAATMYVLGSPCTVLCAKSWGITVVDEELESVNKFHYKVQSCFDIMPYCYILLDQYWSSSCLLQPIAWEFDENWVFRDWRNILSKYNSTIHA